MKFPNDVDFLCVDHFDENLYQEVLQWVGEGRRAAFFSKIPKISSDPRVKIYHLESPLQKKKFIKEIAWSAVLQKMHVIGNELKEELEEVHLASHLILSEAAGYWVQPMENARKNRGDFQRGMEFKGVFQNIPAIIVGAGPSLDKNQALIQRFEDRALIFAGGSALSMINVKPHFSAFLDPKAPKRTYPHKEVPFCYQARMDPDIYQEMEGEKILFPDSSVPAINWLYGEDRLFDGGWTVGNFLTEIALLMGCSPIIFVGMDFAYDGKKKYSTLKEEAEVEPIQVGGLTTQRDWLMAALWTQGKAKGHKFFSLSEGILGLPKFSSSELEFEKRDLRALVTKTLSKVKKEQSNRWSEWDASLKRCKQNIGPLESEIVYEMLLEPLWQIWRPIFQREVEKDPTQKIEHHQCLFFQNVLSEHVD